MTTNNEAFEKWHEKEFGAKPSFNRDHEGSSHWDGDKQDRKRGWDAATTEANKRIKELESKVAELKEDLIELRQQTNIRCAQVQERDAKIYELQASNNHLREALDMLVITKEYKDKQGKDAVYETMRTNAWNVAEQALSTTPAQSLQAHDDELIEKCEDIANYMPLNADEMHEYRASDDCKAMAWDISHAIRALKVYVNE